MSAPPEHLLLLSARNVFFKKLFTPFLFVIFDLFLSDFFAAVAFAKIGRVLQ